MLVKTKRGKRSARGRRQGHEEHGGDRAAGATLEIQDGPLPRERRQGGPSEDRALYTCECGYAFQALVTTSVGCPHCDRTQAW